jgi:mRNA interferase HigB
LQTKDILMHVIARKIFNDVAKQYPNNASNIDDLYRLLNSGKFTTPTELRKMVPSLDNFRYKDKWWVIDIGGNNLRLIAFIDFSHERVFVKHIVTHSQYDKLTARYRKKELQ